MHKVFIWGTGYWGDRCFDDILPEVDVIGFVESDIQHNICHGKPVIPGEKLTNYEYDYLILANSHENEIMKNFCLNEQKVLYYRQGPRLNNVKLFRYQLIDQAREMMPYLSVKCDELTFLYNKTDLTIPNFMHFYGVVWSKYEMEFFWREAPRRQAGIFMDIGANIGTTSIFFRKKLAEELTYIAFDPVKENCKILKANCILNDCEDIVVENVGVSDTEGTKGIDVVDVNYGGSRIIDHMEGIESCKTVRLDEYVKTNAISPQDVSYIWMDVEGHEANAIAGARELLSVSGASLFMEYNAIEYKTNGKLESILHDLCSIYRFFICYEQYEAGNTEKRHIDELPKLADEMNWQQCNVLFMK